MNEHEWEFVATVSTWNKWGTETGRTKIRKVRVKAVDLRGAIDKGLQVLKDDRERVVDWNRPRLIK